MNLKKILIPFILILSFTLPFLADQDITLFEGELKGSKILIVEPVEWNKHLLILAHEYREPHLPLTAEFDYRDRFFTPLISQGWMIASTSYRKNGFAFKEGFEDVGYLRDFVIEKYGRPEKIFVQGQSMGGSIAIWISEKLADDYHGAVSIDPAIRDALDFTYKPLIPLLFLSNQNEADQVKGYLARLDKEAIKPAQWIVRRDGHLNINPEEKLAAFKGLVDYADNRDILMENEILIIPTGNPSTAIFQDNAAYTRVTRIHPSYGNVDTEFTPEDAEKLSLSKGEVFIVGSGRKEYPVLLGTTFRDVPKGEWIAFFKEDGLLKISRNKESAEKVLGCKEGDLITIRKRD